MKKHARRMLVALTVIGGVLAMTSFSIGATPETDKDKQSGMPDIAQTIVNQLLEGPPLVFSDRHRGDPFRPPTAGGIPTEREVSIAEMRLLGIVWDKEKGERVAAFRAVTGARLAYVLRGGVLLADDNSIIVGVVGEVEERRVVLRQGPRVVEFYLPGG